MRRPASQSTVRLPITKVLLVVLCHVTSLTVDVRSRRDTHNHVSNQTTWGKTEL